MYNIKDVVNRLKEIANIDSNTQLANLLNVSYNTLNTWIKRGKIPQEVLIEFVINYESSLDYILFGTNSKNNNSNNLFSNTNLHTKTTTFRYYGSFEELGIGNKGAYLTLDKNSLHSNAYYLLNTNNLFAIAKVIINIFNKNIELYFNNNSNVTITLEEFESINLGMITEFTI